MHGQWISKCGSLGVLGRRRKGVALGRRHIDRRAALQPGAGIGVGCKGSGMARATHHRTERTSDRCKEATTAMTCFWLFLAAEIFQP